SVEEVLAAASAAKAKGATRFCMGAAWRGPKQKDLEPVLEMVRAVKSLGLETCATLGLLRDGQAEQLRDAGLDYYNHNIDTAREAGLHVCCGGIVGMGETRSQRAGMIAQLASMTPPPESVPINNLVPVPGTPLAESQSLDWTEFVRTIAVARITMPKSFVRL